ncbi:MAG: transglutaminase family protein [Rhodobiaceae bacterium]|nr:transglutaminase family protein [Rhodobiaceae bacterium]MCC0049180.1 transglutaminase family protein [Rhodobiaceae bacterium]
MLYDISLRISYDYDNAADSSRHMVRLLPADLPGEQRLIAGNLDIHPRPDELTSGMDFFWNRFSQIAFLHTHEDIDFNMHARVERYEQSTPLDISPPLERIGSDIRAQMNLGPLAPHHFLGPSPRVPQSLATAAFAHEHLSGRQTVFSAVRTIGEILNKELAYDPEATLVDTPMDDAFAARRGVCQDFSHIMISCLRSVGIPAGYVSGFLRTVPPPGQPRMEGADAMHAWVRAWCGADMGWIEYDPTNAADVGTDHIVVARGRDYSDIAPVRGQMRIYGDHKTTQSVDVLPL